MTSAHLTEEERIAYLKTWWKDNAIWIGSAIFIGITTTFAWYGWENIQRKQATLASDLYQQLLTADRASLSNEAKDHAIQLIEQYQNTSYANYAALLLAKYSIASQDYPAAKEKLSWVIDHSKQDQLVHIARLRLARILIAEGRLDEANTLLAIKKPGKFSPNYDTLRGDAARLQGDRDKAREAYLKAKQSDMYSQDGILDMKLEELGNG